MLDASPTKISATGVQLNASTRKGGGLKQAQKQMQVGRSDNILDVGYLEDTFLEEDILWLLIMNLFTRLILIERGLPPIRFFYTF
jgi:hypothetical protein